jgi:hypothetical protein
MKRNKKASRCLVAMNVQVEPEVTCIATARSPPERGKLRNLVLLLEDGLQFPTEN